MKKDLSLLNSYRFQSDQEPSDEQLHQLMKEVAIEVKQKALAAKAQFQQQLKELCIAGRKGQD